MTVALVFVECANDLASLTKHSIRQVQGVLEAHSVKGGSAYDLIVKVQAADERQLKDTIAALRKAAGVIAMATCIVYGGM